MKITIRHVAQEAGVSVCTVSRVLNGNHQGKVSEETREKVIEVASRLRYRPNLMARGLRQKRTGLVGVVVPDIHSSFLPSTLEGIQEVAEEEQYSILLYTTRSQARKEAQYLQILAQKGVDGVIWMPLTEEASRIGQLVKDSFPMVQIYTRAPGLESPAIEVDQTQGAYLATAHLLRLGHTRVAHLAAPGSPGAHGEKRQEGYARALMDNGIQVDPNYIIDTSYFWDRGYQAAAKILSLNPRPTAVVAICDLVAWGLIRGLEEAGVRVPEDMAVVGFDDLEFAPRIRPGLTTMAQPKAELGRMAMRHLLDSFEGREVTSTVIIPELIIRGSCGARLAGVV